MLSNAALRATRQVIDDLLGPQLAWFGKVERIEALELIADACNREARQARGELEAKNV